MIKKVEKKLVKNFIVTGVLFLVFVLFTIGVSTIDVQPIGPNGSRVGFATWNKLAAEMIGLHPLCYTITEWFGYISIMVAGCFALLGLGQFIQRKSFFRIDGDILLLGFFYCLVMVAYALFEMVIINYRPVILDAEEGLEASFPSSHTMLVICIMGTAIMQFHARIKTEMVRNLVEIVSALMIVATIIGRLLSGVHWFTDIVGGILLGTAFVMLYYSVMLLSPEKCDIHSIYHLKNVKKS